MSNYQFDLYCFRGGWGWGETGQKGRYIITAKTKKDAIKELKNSIPGGWYYSYNGKTNKKAGLRTDLKSLQYEIGKEEK